MPEHENTNAYLRTQVLTATPEQLRMMLLDAALKHARLTLEGVESDDHETVYENSTRARDIVLELINGIRDEPDPALAERVRELYLFIYRELVDAGLRREVAKMRKVIELLDYERETWRQLLAQLAAERAGGSRPAANAPTTVAPRSPLPYPSSPGDGRAPLSLEA